MGRSLAVVLALAGLAAAAGCGSAGGDPSPRALLPDLDQVTPAALTLERHGGRLLLAFTSSVENAGAGPMLLVGSRRAGEATMRVRQLVRRSDGSLESRAVPGAALRFVRAKTHSHWHLEPFERYELRRLDGTAAARSRKEGFCLGDRYRAQDPPASSPARAVWTGECGRNQPGRVTVREGISVGYGDDYPPFLEGQSIDVTGLEPGRYVLVHLVNENHALRESDHGDDAASVLLELDPPRVRILERCPDRPACP